MRALTFDRPGKGAIAGAVIVLVLTTMFVAAAGSRFVRDGDGIGGDFLANYTGGALVRTGNGERLYDLDAQARMQTNVSPAGADEDLLPFVLPPSAAYPFAALSAMPYTAALVTFAVANIIVLAVLLALLRDELRDTELWLRRLILAVAALSMPAVLTLSWGQVDLFVVLGMLLGWRLMRGGREVVAGMALSLALIKPHFLIGVVLLLVVRREWRTLGVLSAGACGFVLVPSLALGPGVLADYMALLSGARAMPAAMDVRPEVMANARGFVVSVIGRDAAWAWMPLMLGVSAWAVRVCVVRWRREPGSAQSWAMAMALPLLASPHVHMQSAVIAVMAVALCAGDGLIEIRVRGRGIGVASGLLWLCVALFAAWFATALGLAVMVVPVAAMFWWCASSASSVAEAAGDASRTKRLAA